MTTRNRNLILLISGILIISIPIFALIYITQNQDKRKKESNSVTINVVSEIVPISSSSSIDSSQMFSISPIIESLSSTSSSSEVFSLPDNNFLVASSSSSASVATSSSSLAASANGFAIYKP